MQPSVQFNSRILVAFAAVALLFPSSASVLCIAPGLHVEEEDINAFCPASFATSASADDRPIDGLNAAISGHCTDIFLTPYGRGAVLEPSGQSAQSPLADYCPDSRILEHTCFLLHQPQTIKLYGLVALRSTVPLRC